MLAGSNKTLIDLVVPYVVDTLQTYTLEPEHLVFMSSIESLNQATDVWNEVSSQAKSALTKAYNQRCPKAGPEFVCVRRNVAVGEGGGRGGSVQKKKRLSKSSSRTKNEAGASAGVDPDEGSGRSGGREGGGGGGGGGGGMYNEELSGGVSSSVVVEESGLGREGGREAEKAAEMEEELEAFKQSWGG